MHIIWQMMGDHKPADVQRDFMKFTAQHIKYYLKEKNPGNYSGRNYHFLG
jgi:hypothetical protein